MTPRELADADPPGEVFGYTREEVELAIERSEYLSQENVRVNDDLAVALSVIRDALRVLHKTSVSKKKIADRMRACLGLMPGEPVRD